ENWRRTAVGSRSGGVRIQTSIGAASVSMARMRSTLGCSPISRTRKAARLPGAPLGPWLPASCIVCAADDPAGMCPFCESALPGYRVERCPRCAIAGPSQGSPCGECLGSPPAFDRTIVLADYAPPLDRVVHALKFGRDAS